MVLEYIVGYTYHSLAIFPLRAPEYPVLEKMGGVQPRTRGHQPPDRVGQEGRGAPPILLHHWEQAAQGEDHRWVSSGRG